MSEPFDPDHILNLRYIPVAIEYSFNVTIEQLRSRHENRNLESPQLWRNFSLNLSGDDPANSAEKKSLQDAYIRARGTFEGFYLKLPSTIEAELIPVRFDSPFRFNFIAQDETNFNIFWDIQDLRLVQIPSP